MRPGYLEWPPKGRGFPFYRPPNISRQLDYLWSCSVTQGILTYGGVCFLEFRIFFYRFLLLESPYQIEKQILTVTRQKCSKRSTYYQAFPSSTDMSRLPRKPKSRVAHLLRSKISAWPEKSPRDACGFALLFKWKHLGGFFFRFSPRNDRFHGLPESHSGYYDYHCEVGSNMRGLGFWQTDVMVMEKWLLVIGLEGRKI